MSSDPYVHGYSETESRRLADQADTLSELLHRDSVFPEGSRVLEAGCGTGAQTRILAGKNPACSFVSVDVSGESVGIARKRLERDGITNVKLEIADIFHLPFPEGSFDHVFLCFVLEHLSDPSGALDKLTKVLKPGGSLTVIEGDHGSACFFPPSRAAREAIQCLIDIQSAMGGNALIGRQLYPLLTGAGLKNCYVSPRLVYVDASRPDLAEGFTKKTFTAMVAGVRQESLDRGLIDTDTWSLGIRDLYRTAGADGTFSYTFYRATGTKE